MLIVRLHLGASAKLILGTSLLWALWSLSWSEAIRPRLWSSIGNSALRGPRLAKRTDGEATTFKATAHVRSGDNPLVLVKMSGSSHGGEHSSAVKVEDRILASMKPTKCRKASATF